MEQQKLKVAMVSLTSCEGCYFSLLDLGNEFLEIADKIDLVKFRLLKEDPPSLLANSELRRAKEKYDITFVEGSPISEDNFDKLIDLRLRTKKMIVLGGCAHTGGTYAMRNHTDKKKACKYVYPKTNKKIFNPNILELSKVVHIDGIIPTCPVNPREFVRFMSFVLNSLTFKITERPVCYECQLAQTSCLLKMGLPCFGPMALGGCDAPCPRAGMPCQLCRGPMKEIQWDNFEKKMKDIMGAKVWEKDYNEILEIFNVKDKISVE
ncbi:MAG: hypothetical protein WC663_04725 [Patescibacteria group bacterium]|jgi:coenzyme F420-reducing hydrogenase gamma subunit